MTKYFSSDAALIPEFKQSLFKKKKDPNLFRVFCLGESSMFGTPHQMTANIPGIVRKQLRHLYPQKEIEVINLGGAAINSNVNLDLAKEVVKYQPDLILLYLGHNEFYGPDGVGASWLEKRFGFITKLKYTMRDLRINEAQVRNSAAHRQTADYSLKTHVMRSTKFPKDRLFY